MVHHFLFVLFLGLASTGLSSDVVWVHAGSSTAGHADTCLSARLSPTDELFQILWDVNVFNGVVADLNMKSSGLKGCCAAGLWCLNGTCFTQGYGVFMNHGPLINSTAVPVYTCFNRNSAEPSPQILSASFSNGSLTVIGNELGYAEESTLISAAGPNCYEIESCSRVCRPCSLSSTCGIGSACFSGNCYQYCSGIFDLSCPCDYTCQAEYLYSNGWSVPIFVCSPNPVDIGGCPDSVITTQMEFRCSAPQLLYVPDEQEVEIGFIIESKSTTGNFIIPVHKSCAGNTDCFDNNICTVDVCNMASLTCEYNPVASCESTAFRVREHQYSTVYDTLAEYGMGDMHQSFVTKIRDSNHVSSVSIVDDAPHEYIDIGFNFSYFGSVFSRLAINPNGAISFPPFQPCELMAYPSFDVSFYLIITII